MVESTSDLWCQQTPGDTEGQGSLACCSPRGCRTTEQQQIRILAGEWWSYVSKQENGEVSDQIISG